MHISSLIALASMVAAAPFNNIVRIIPREVPQEHSHEKYLRSVRASLNLNNPLKILDPVFSLLGDGAAARGAGGVTNLACFQQIVADQAFTNAKAAGNVQAMTDALVFRAIERNTQKVGQKSAICTETAVNSEIAAITQHQDPASEGAAATNKASTIALAKQIASIGGNVTQALDAGTFSPGSTNDGSGKGKTCDDPNDPEGCIFTQKLIVLDITTDELNAAVAGISPGCSASKTNSTSTSKVNSTSTSKVNSTSTSKVNSTKKLATSQGQIDPTTLGDCDKPFIEFGTGFGNRKEDSYEPVDRTNFGHGSAQAIGIITDFMCDNLINKCGVKRGDATDTACRALATSVGNGKNDGALADKWNAGFGGTSDFATNPLTAPGDGELPGSTKSPQTGSKTNSSATPSNTASTSTGSNTNPNLSKSLVNLGNLGTCGSPEIAFATGLDGRTQPSFQAVDQTSFNHGSALNIGVIASFICQRLSSSCGAGADAQATCTKAQSAATAAGGTTGAAADAFNLVFDIVTNFATAPSDGLPLATPASKSASNSAANKGTTDSNDCSTPENTANGNNLQTFTGSLGGISPPAVTTGGRGFQVEGNASFPGISEALVRSCDVQHNQCSNKANASGNKGSLTVNACADQQQQCNAKAKSGA